MLPRRKVVAVTCVLLVPGSILVTLGYALHLRSSAYRRGIEETLGERLGMSVSIGAIRPLTLNSRALDDVHVRLHDRGEEVFSCRQALWGAGAASVPGRGGAPCPTSLLELRDGWLLVGTAGWTPMEYQQMLTGGLGHDFAALGLGEVRLKRIDLRFSHPMAEFTAGASSGVVLFDEDGEGQASLNCLRLNDVEVDQPVNIAARFTPGQRLVFHEVRLTVPTIPLASLRLERLLNQTVSCGEFDGSITYRQARDTETVEVAGALHGADLLAFTADVPGGPFHGTVDVDLDSASFLDRKLRDLALHGRMSDLRLSEILPGLVKPATAGQLELQIDQMRWAEGRWAYLSARGGCRDLSLDALSTIWGEGKVTGSVVLTIRSLLIIDDWLRFADVEIVASPPEDAPGLIDRAALARVVRHWLGVEMDAILPEHIEYTQLGARLVVDDGQLRVLGTHGPDGRTILTVSLFGRPWGMIRQPKNPFPVPDLLAMLRERAAEVDADQVRDWWERLAPPDEEGPPP